jgi:lipoprotein-releasing system permease protein
MRELAGYQEQINAIEISLVADADVYVVQKQLQQSLGSGFRIVNRYQQNEVLYKVMESERWAVLAILSFIIAIAGFNIIGSVSMLVVEKEKDISVLNVLGMPKSWIQRIFMMQGLLLSLIGYSIGATLAFIICTIQILFGVVPLQGGSFVVDAYPVKMNPADFMLAFLIVAGIGLLASLLPAKKAHAGSLRMAA